MIEDFNFFERFEGDGKGCKLTAWGKGAENTLGRVTEKSAFVLAVLLEI